MCSVTIEKPAREKILERAMSLFAVGGIAATSLREVAKAAAVSPALIVHHFGGKQGLVAAVDDSAVRRFGRAYGEESAAGEAGEAGELLRRRAEQTAAVMREQPEVCAYLGRAMVEATPGSVRLLRMMIGRGRAEIDDLAARGALREGVDRQWVTLQHFFLIWAPLGFRAVLEGDVLDGPLLGERELRRWVDANVELLERGVYS
jgi:AcrR family transcriptional regulator